MQRRLLLAYAGMIIFEMPDARFRDARQLGISGSLASGIWYLKI